MNMEYPYEITFVFKSVAIEIHFMARISRNRLNTVDFIRVNGV